MIQGMNFTAWLRDQGYGHLTPPDHNPRPLASRIALLVKQGSPQADINKLGELWEEWRSV